MKIYLLFGKTGSGKTYIGKLLENQHIFHIDGDKHITDEMRDCLRTDTQMTEVMIGRFVKHLATVINQYKEQRTESFVVTQALYLDEYRQELLSAIPELEFVLVDSPETARMQRIKARNDLGESKVTPAYALQMDKRFEQPKHSYKLIMNCDNKLKLQHSLEDAMPELFTCGITPTL